jgi:hypothetical protein
MTTTGGLRSCIPGQGGHKLACVRWLFIAAVLASIGTTTASATLPKRFPAANTKVASGAWDGTNWTLYAGETATPTSFYYCARVQLANADHRGGMACSGGGIRTPGVYLPTSSPAPGFGYGIGYGGSTACPKNFNVWAGIVVANADQVTFTLKSGATVTVKTFASPPGFAPSLRFWALETPCGEDITAIKAHDRNGRVVGDVGQFLIRHLGP